MRKIRCLNEFSSRTESITSVNENKDADAEDELSWQNKQDSEVYACEMEKIDCRAFIRFVFSPLWGFVLVLRIVSVNFTDEYIHNFRHRRHFQTTDENKIVGTVAPVVACIPPEAVTEMDVDEDEDEDGDGVDDESDLKLSCEVEVTPMLFESSEKTAEKSDVEGLSNGLKLRV